MSELHRKNTYQNKTIFIDGMWRCGKSLLTQIGRASCRERV